MGGAVNKGKIIYFWNASHITKRTMDVLTMADNIEFERRR